MRAHIDSFWGHTAWVLSKMRPAAFALTLASVAIGITWAGLERIDGPWEQIVAGFAFASAFTFMAAWLSGSAAVMRIAYAASVFLWVYVAWVSVIALNTAPANWMIALAWASLSGGSYWLEQSEHMALLHMAGER